MEQSNINIIKILEHLGSATVEVNSLQAKCGRYEKALEKLKYLSQALGQPGCTWGDTKFDSMSVAEGYNHCLDNVVRIVNKALSGDGEKEVEVEKPMEYNTCKTCGAGGAKAGILINNECRNCYETRKTGAVTIHTNLERTQDELDKTIGILNQKEDQQ
jgi:hypothetical protein